MLASACRGGGRAPAVAAAPAPAPTHPTCDARIDEERLSLCTRLTWRSYEVACADEDAGAESRRDCERATALAADGIRSVRRYLIAQGIDPRDVAALGLVEQD